MSLPPRVDRPSPPPPSKTEPLTPEQLRRGRALGVAREALAERSPFTTGAVDPVALVTVADWVLGQESEKEPDEDRMVVRDHNGDVLYTLGPDGAKSDGLTETEREADRQAEQAREWAARGEWVEDPDSRPLDLTQAEQARTEAGGGGCGGGCPTD